MRAKGGDLPMEKATAVHTCLGVLNGRDCIYLDQVKRNDRDNLIFTGDINGHLVSQHYQLFTYDDVYNIIAASYSFEAEL